LIRTLAVYLGLGGREWNGREWREGGGGGGERVREREVSKEKDEEKR
jgi:hypothetical protein